jgi:hypothetical protein
MTSKPSWKIRIDALRMARRKLDEGCEGCARGYAEVATRHGATRRDLVKMGLATFAGLVGVGEALPVLAADDRRPNALTGMAAVPHVARALGNADVEVIRRYLVSNGFSAQYSEKHIAYLTTPDGLEIVVLIFPSESSPLEFGTVTWSVRGGHQYVKGAIRRYARAQVVDPETDILVQPLRVDGGTAVPVSPAESCRDCLTICCPSCVAGCLLFPPPADLICMAGCCGVCWVICPC